MYRQMYLKDVEIVKKVHIVGLNDENIKQWIYFFGTDKCQNRQTKTSNFVKLLGKISFALAHYEICR